MILGKHIAVVGAGIVGLAIALRLRRDGFRVTIYDPMEAGSQTSAGNAAIIMTSQTVPVAEAAILRKLPSLLQKKDGPLTIRKMHLPALLPWISLFAKNNTRKRRAEISEILKPLSMNSFSLWSDLAGPYDTPRHFSQNGLLYAYKTRKAFRAAKLDASIRGEHGVPYEIIDREDMLDLEPALIEGLEGGILYNDVVQCLDPRKLSDAISGLFRTSGGEVRRLAVRSIKPVDRNTVKIVTEEGETAYEEVIVAAGIESSELLAPLGTRPKIASERGYNLMLHEPEMSLERPIVAGEGRFVITPLEKGIRLAGTSEFAHPEAQPNWDRADRLFDQAQELLPELDGEDNATRWCGSRDSTPDGLPHVGRLKKHRNVMCAFGHGHMGLTLAATTAQLISDILLKREPLVDIAALSPERF
ncbi:MAG: FAD-binding oxidoreductase [Hyphomicrobiales bacterium]|nr:FAD-binding oxidoreductase [Hyphomicrobiales bacterium]